MLIVVLVVLPALMIIGGILFFNIYIRKQIKKDVTPPPELDSAYIEAEKTKSDDEDLANVFSK